MGSAVAKTVAAADVKPLAKTANVLDIETAQKPLPLPVLLLSIKDKYKKPLPSMLAEIARLSFGPGKVSVEEYLDLRLFDDAGLAGADKAQFVGMRGSKIIGLRVNKDSQWCGVIGDKLTFYTLLNGFGLPTIQQRAFYHPKLQLPSLQMLKSLDDLKAYLARETAYPLFAKPTGGSLSLGTLAIDGYDPATGTLRLPGGRTVGVEELYADISTNYRTGYMFQERLIAHPEVAKLCGERIGTVRVYTIQTAKGAEVFRTCWKIAAGNNRADNFWRKGNMLGALDMESGEIKRVIRGYGLDQIEVENHPDTGARLVGTVLPGFREALKLATWAADTFWSLPLIGWDIALTDRGPVLVEANDTPDMRLVEMAERRGVLDDRLKSFMSYWDERWASGKKRIAADNKSTRDKSIKRLANSIVKSD
jgi:hypothetical protein